MDIISKKSLDAPQQCLHQRELTKTKSLGIMQVNNSQFHSSVIIALNNFVYTEMKTNEIIPILTLLTKKTSTLGLSLDEKPFPCGSNYREACNPVPP